MAKEKEPVKSEKNLMQKLVEVLADLGPIEKSKRNPHFGYNYVGEGQMMAELRHRLANRNIFLTTSVETCVPHYYANDPKMGVFVSVTTTHTFHDADSGEKLPVGGAGVGWDSGDKGVYKAITGATKYALMKNFLVTDEQEPESGEQAPATSTAAGRSPGKHTRTKPYEEATGDNDPKAAHDLLELKAFLTEHKIPDAFLLLLLTEKKLIDGHTKTVAQIKPGILRRCLDDKSKGNLIKAWAAQKKDEESGSATPPPKESRKTTPTQGDDGMNQTTNIVRKPITEDISPADVLEQEGIKNWRAVKIHFGEHEGKALGKMTVNQLSWWVKNYKPKPYKGTWQEKDLLLDAALCLASMEMAGGDDE